MYTHNGIVLSIVRTWTFQGEYQGDPRDGLSCVELVSQDKRYSLITDVDTLADQLELVEG